MSDIKFGRGSECNFPGKSAKGEFTLIGDKTIKIEKIYTIINFPGGHFELARCDDGTYWAHISVVDGGKTIDARIDAYGRYLSPDIKAEIHAADFNHIAVRIKAS